MRDVYLRDNNSDRLRALVNACGDGHLGAVMALSAMVNDVNSRLPGDCGKLLLSPNMM